MMGGRVSNTSSYIHISNRGDMVIPCSYRTNSGVSVERELVLTGRVDCIPVLHRKPFVIFGSTAHVTSFVSPGPSFFPLIIEVPTTWHIIGWPYSLSSFGFYM